MAVGIGRRQFISALGGTTVAWPLTARAQQPAISVIGFLGPTSPDAIADRLSAFHQGLGQSGFVEGRNVAIEYKWAEDQYDRLPALAAELVQRQVAVIFTAGGTPTAVAAKQASSTIPIVFVIGADPIKFGLVDSLNRPGANVTGVSFLVSMTMAKQLEVLHEAVPIASLIGFLVNPANPIADSDTREVVTAGKRSGAKYLL